MNVSEHNIEITMRRCRHFTGVQNKTCKAGVRYEDVRPLPCLGRTENPAVCDSLSRLTREEAIKLEEERAETTKKYFIALSAAKESAKKAGFKKGQGGSGSLPCPVCETGALNYQVASVNGHMWARCTTQGCVAWIE